jgi:hypothetical protein
VRAARAAGREGWGREERWFCREKGASVKRHEWGSVGREKEKGEKKITKETKGNVGSAQEHAMMLLLRALQFAPNSKAKGGKETKKSTPAKERKKERTTSATSRKRRRTPMCKYPKILLPKPLDFTATHS